MLRLIHDSDEALSVHFGDQILFSYGYQVKAPQVESPRPFFHPVHTLGGDLVTLFRPHDHVWHRGISWSLPNVDDANFWGGVTYRRDVGYVQLPNNGAMCHDEFLRLQESPGAVSVAHRLHWETEQGATWFREIRRFDVTVDLSRRAWVLAFATGMTNISGRPIVIGSPTTEGRENAGYGGLFWRGPRSFSGGRVYAPDQIGGDELMGIRAPWMGFSGRHDGTGHASTLVFVDANENPDHPTQWFVRSEMYACLCPAPFFDTEVTIAPEDGLFLRYAIVVADGDPGLDGAEELARLGAVTLSKLDTVG